MIEVAVHGTGDDVLLLHGNPVPPESVDPLRHALQRDYRVLIPDLSGHGLDPVALLPRLEQALADKGVRRAAVVGHSFGAYRAFQLAASGAIEVTRIVALSPFAHLPEEVRRGFLELADAIAAGPFDLAPVLAPHWFSAGYLSANPDTEQLLRRWFDGLGADGLIASGRVESAAADLRPALETVEVPVYLRVGSLDGATPPAWAQEIASLLPCSRLEIVAGVGHMPQYEDLEETARAVLRFLDEGGQVSAQ